MNRQHDVEPYWQNEDDWLCTVEFLPSDDPEGLIRRFELSDKSYSKTNFRASDTRSVRRAKGLVLIGHSETTWLRGRHSLQGCCCRWLREVEQFAGK